MEKLTEILKKLWEGKISPDDAEKQVLRLFNVSGSADIIKFGAYLTGHDEKTIKQMLNDYQRHLR